MGPLTNISLEPQPKGQLHHSLNFTTNNKAPEATAVLYDASRLKHNAANRHLLLTARCQIRGKAEMHDSTFALCTLEAQSTWASHWQRAKG